MNLLIDSLRHHLHPRTDVYVGGNMAVYYSPLQARARDFLVPDVFAAADGQPERERKSWVIWEELGHGPFVVIELLSASTHAGAGFPGPLGVKSSASIGRSAKLRFWHPAAARATRRA